MMIFLELIVIIVLSCCEYYFMVIYLNWCPSVVILDTVVCSYLLLSLVSAARQCTLNVRVNLQKTLFPNYYQYREN